MNFHKIPNVIISSALCLSLLAGCGSNDLDAFGGVSEEGDSAGKASSVTSAAVSDFPELFSKKDLSGEYDASEAAVITLDGSAAVCDSASVLTDGSVITITAAGTYILTGTLDDGMVVVDADKEAKVRLVLNGVTICSTSSAAIYVRQADKVFITTAQDTENTLRNGGSYTAIDENNIDAVIFSKEDLTLNGSGNLTIDAAAGIGVVSKDDLIITGASYTVTSAGDGFSGKDVVGIAGGTFLITSDGDGISSKADLYVADGSFTITSGGGCENGEVHREEFFGGRGGGFGGKGGSLEDGFDGMKGSKPEVFGGRGGQPDSKEPPEGMEFPEKESAAQADAASSYDADNTDNPSTKGVKCDGNMRIDGGDFALDCADDALHANGDFTINGGTIKLASGDDGIHADGTVAITQGTLSVTESYEGIEGAQIVIAGGDITLHTSDDGLNASMGTGAQTESDCRITVSGGILHVNAGGDGIDSNGSLTQTGGEIYVCGPTDSANAALDYGTDISLEGGIMIAVDDSAMQERMDKASPQGVIRTRISSQSAGTELVLKDSGGSILAAFTPDKAYSTVIISHPNITQGNDYMITAGNEAVTVCMDSLLYDDISSGLGRR